MPRRVRPPGPPGSGIPSGGEGPHKDIHGTHVIPGYGPSTPSTQRAASVEMAKRIARQRAEQIQDFRKLGTTAVVRRAGGGLNWYKGDKFIGQSDQEDTPVRFTKRPRRLNTSRVS